jgi:hypothetical protein
MQISLSFRFAKARLIPTLNPTPNDSVANLYIIDQSLKGSGGHHLDYARCIALSAQRQGFQTTVGTHRKFNAKLWLDHPSSKAGDDATKIVPVFPKTVYQTDSYLAGLQQMTRSRSSDSNQHNPPSNFLNRISQSAANLLHKRRRHWIARQFADGCARMFQNTVFESGDHVFLTAVSELELSGLPIYFASNPTTNRATWHLQFHFNLFDGRPDEYANQKANAFVVADNMMSAVKHLCGHSVRFYTTSQTLAIQYNSLGVGQFTSLPYPIADEFRLKESQAGVSNTPIETLNFVNRQATYKPEEIGASFTDPPDKRNNLLPYSACPTEEKQNHGDRSPVEPLRMVCPGGIRREKGQQEYLQSLVDNIWQSHLSAGHLKLVVQRPTPKWPSTKEKINLQLPDTSTSAIEYVQHPLPTPDYVDLIRSSDIGLLFYDGRKYYSRRAGILGELLACGKPVIVPAGSWLSDQLDEANFSYADRISRQLSSGRVLSVDQLDWNRRNVPLPGGVVSFDQGKHSFEFDVFPEELERVMSLAFAWHWPRESGVYCRIEVKQFSENGELIETDLRVVGVRKRNQRANVLFNVNSRATRVCFTLKNAFGQSSATIHELHIETFLNKSSRPLPIGVVGLVAADQNDLAACVSEMTANYDHYLNSAIKFSTGWNSNHDPALTVDYLVECDQGFQRAA